MRRIQVSLSDLDFEKAKKMKGVLSWDNFFENVIRILPDEENIFYSEERKITLGPLKTGTSQESEDRGQEPEDRESEF